MKLEKRKFPIGALSRVLSQVSEVSDECFA